MVDRVEFDVRDAEDLGEASGEAGLARTCVPHDRQPLHEAIIAAGAQASQTAGSTAHTSLSPPPSKAHAYPANCDGRGRSKPAP